MSEAATNASGSTRRHGLLDADPSILVPRITGLLLCVTAVGQEGVHPLRFVLSAVFFAVVVGRPAWLRSSNIWLGVALVLLAWNALIWRALDNHIFLVSYWALAVGLALRSSDIEGALRANARVLIGLAFLFAVIWKAISPDYLSGAFFHFELLVDTRFSFMADVAGGLEPAAGASNHALVTGFDVTPDPVVLADGPRIGLVSHFLTWWTIGIETVLALAFLAPLRLVPAWFRHGVLGVFCLSTYSLVPVTGFAAVLLTMNCAMPTTAQGRLRAAGGFLFLLAYSVVFQTIRRM